jgi:Ni/Co efflux regulator RcnB
MKKIVSLLVGFGLVLGTCALAPAQEEAGSVEDREEEEDREEDFKKEEGRGAEEGFLSLPDVTACKVCRRGVV